jgi:ribosomal protein S1
MESFAALLEETLGTSDSLEGTVVKGRVISIENDNVLIDVGLKSRPCCPQGIRRPRRQRRTEARRYGRSLP